VVGGVCAGLADSLGIDPVLVRVAFVVLSASGGFGVIAYAVLWATTRVDDRPRPPARRVEVVDVLAVGTVVVGLLVVLRSWGVFFSSGFVLPAIVIAVGSALVPDRGAGRPADAPAEVEDRLGALRVPRLVAGVVLVAAGAIGIVTVSVPVADLGQAVSGAAVALGGLALILLPRLAELRHDLVTERRERIRSQERAEVAAHLHDSVLQTLALIQRRSDDPRTVVSLARRQERELRAWLQGTPEVDEPEGVADLLRRALADVEEAHGVPVEAVVVGDAPLDDAGRALVQACREAAANAAVHSGASKVDVYLEATDARLTAYVRDRGNGFEPSRVPADRRGLAESIVGRMARAGGTAAVHSAPGEGTEVELEVPR
jgi:signal transduction histidine kinase